MSAISLKSISGITSITTPAGVDNQFTLHNNNTTEAVKLDTAGNFHFHNHVNTTGISTASNFKTGTSNLHSTGLNIFDLDVDGQTNLDHVSVAGITTFNNNVHLLDNDYIRFGSSQDLSIFHDGTYNWFWSGGGHPTIHESSGSWTLRSVANQNYIIATENNSVDLYYSGTKRFETTSTGASVTGNLNCTALLPTGNLELVDSNAGNVGRIRMGAGDDFSLYHNGNHSYIQNSTGSVYLDTTGNFYIRNGVGSQTYMYASGNEVALYHTGSKKLETSSDGILVTGKVLAKATQEPQIELQDSDSSHTGAGAETGIRFRDGAGTLQSDIGHYDSGSSNFKINTAINADIQFSTNNTSRVAIGANGIQPSSNNSYDLGSSSYRWRNVYTTDLQLSNEGKTNDVDGTWGNYTIQEGESDLFLINNRNGKKYVFLLKEVS